MSDTQTRALRAIYDITSGAPDIDSAWRNLEPYFDGNPAELAVLTRNMIAYSGLESRPVAQLFNSPAFSAWLVSNHDAVVAALI